MTVDPKSPTTVWTVGHSTRTAEELVRLLQAHGVRTLLDVRTIPRSRHVPQFNREALPATLAAARIGYDHLPALGGFRKPRPNSPNAGWRNSAFRGYADYMQTPEFDRAIEALIERAAHGPVAIMCAEAVPWRCHRSLLADALAARGVEVRHILGPGQAKRHEPTPWARVAGARVTYPPPADAPTTSAEGPRQRHVDRLQ